MLAGTINDPQKRGELDFRVEKETEIDDFMNADPYVRKAVITGHRVEPWNVV